MKESERRRDVDTHILYWAFNAPSRARISLQVPPLQSRYFEVGRGCWPKACTDPEAADPAMLLNRSGLAFVYGDEDRSAKWQPERSRKFLATCWQTTILASVGRLRTKVAYTKGPS